MATVQVTPFELVGADCGPLRGDVRTAAGGCGRPAVVICHGFKGFKDWGFFPHTATRLARAGITAVTFNYSGSGVGSNLVSFSEPERFRRATVSNHLADLEQVWGALAEGRLVEGLARPTALGALGHSLGGGLAAVHAAGRSDCQALVTWAAVSSFVRWDDATVERWRREGTLEVVNTRTGEVLPLATDYLEDLDADASRLDIVRAAGEVRVPWLLLHGDADETVPVAEAQRLRRAAGEMAEMEIVSGAGHTFGACHPWAGSTPELDRVLERTVEWFARYVL